MSGPRRYRDQSSESAVQSSEQVYASENWPRDEQRSHHPCGGGQIGVDQHVAHRYGRFGGAQFQHGAAVESEPPKPEDEHAERHNEDVRRRRRSRAAVASELAESRPKNHHPGQRSPAAGGVNDGRAGEVLESHLVQPSLAPGPRSHDRVDHRGQHQYKDEERPHLDALCHRARYDRRRCSHEHHLEEPVRHRGVTRVFHYAPDCLGGSGFVACDQRDLSRASGRA